MAKDPQSDQHPEKKPHLYARRFRQSPKLPKILLLPDTAEGLVQLDQLLPKIHDTIMLCFLKAVDLEIRPNPALRFAWNSGSEKP